LSYGRVTLEIDRFRPSLLSASACAQFPALLPWKPQIQQVLNRENGLYAEQNRQTSSRR